MKLVEPIIFFVYNSFLFMGQLTIFLSSTGRYLDCLLPEPRLLNQFLSREMISQLFIVDTLIQNIPHNSWTFCFTHKFGWISQAKLVLVISFERESDAICSLEPLLN